MVQHVACEHGCNCCSYAFLGIGAVRRICWPQLGASISSHDTKVQPRWSRACKQTRGQVTHILTDMQPGTGQSCSSTHSCKTTRQHTAPAAAAPDSHLARHAVGDLTQLQLHSPMRYYETAHCCSCCCTRHLNGTHAANQAAAKNAFCNCTLTRSSTRTGTCAQRPSAKRKQWACALDMRSQSLP